MTWLLAYLLFGFVVSWIGTNVYKKTSDNGWRWELAAVILWPITVLVVIAIGPWRRGGRVGTPKND